MVNFIPVYSLVSNSMEKSLENSDRNMYNEEKNVKTFELKDNGEKREDIRLKNAKDKKREQVRIKSSAKIAERLWLDQERLWLRNG